MKRIGIATLLALLAIMFAIAAKQFQWGDWALSLGVLATVGLPVGWLIARRS